MIRKFEITTSSHHMKAIQLESPTEAERFFLKRAVMSQMMDDIFYQKKEICSPFLQSDHPNFLLIEFWKPDGAEEFVDFLNSDHPEVVKSKKFAEEMS